MSAKKSKKGVGCICKWTKCSALQRAIKAHGAVDDPWSGGLQSIQIGSSSTSTTTATTATTNSIKTLAFVGGIKLHLGITDADLKNRKFIYIARHHFSRCLCASRKTRTPFLTKLQAQVLDRQEGYPTGRCHADAFNEVGNIIKNNNMMMGQQALLDQHELDLHGQDYVQPPIVTKSQVEAFIKNKCVDNDWRKFIFPPTPTTTTTKTTTRTTATSTKKDAPAAATAQPPVPTKPAPAAAAAAAAAVTTARKPAAAKTAAVATTKKDAPAAAAQPPVTPKPAPAAVTTAHKPAAAKTAAVALVAMHKTAATTPAAAAAAPATTTAAPKTATRKAAPAAAPPVVTMPLMMPFIHPPGGVPPPTYFRPGGPLFVHQPLPPIGIGFPSPPPLYPAAVGAPISAAQEQDFQLSMYHYCLWKHQQIKRCTKKPPPPAATGANTTGAEPVSPQNATTAASTTATAASTSAAATTGTTTNASNNGTTSTTTTTDWGRIVATLESEIPHLAGFKKAGHSVQLEHTTPPVLAKLYTELPAMHQNVEWLQQRLQTYHAMSWSATTAAAAVATMPRAANNNNNKNNIAMPGGPNATSTNNKKRKTVESPRPTDAIDWSAFEKVSEDQTKKKFKTAASLLPKGAPKQVVDLVKTLKADARNERKNASKVIKRLEAKVQNIEAEKDQKLKAIKEALEKKHTAKKEVQQTAEAAERAARQAKYNSVPFETRVEQLEHFRKGHGHCDVPTSAKARKAGGLAAELTWWVQAIRRNWRLIQDDPGRHRTDESFVNNNHPSHLSASRIATLESIGFRFSCDRKIPLSFEERYEELKKYKKQHGHVDVPRSEKGGLGEFCHSYRTYFKTGALSQDKITAFEALGFKFQVRKPLPSFEERVEECKDWRRKHQNLTIPAPKDIKANSNKKDGDCEGEDNTASNNGTGGTGIDENQTPEEKEAHEKLYSFCRWAKAIRVEYEKFNKGLQSRLNKTKIKQLDNLGFDWTIREEIVRRSEVNRPPRHKRKVHEEHFDSRIATLRKIHDEYGSINVESRKKFFGEDQEAHKNLYQWMREQRRMFAAQKVGKWSSLTEERMTKLWALDFVFEPHAHYNYNSEDGEDDDDSDDEDDDEDLEESSPRSPVRMV